MAQQYQVSAFKLNQHSFDDSQAKKQFTLYKHHSPLNSRNQSSLIQSQHVLQLEENLQAQSNITNILSSALQYFEDLNKAPSGETTQVNASQMAELRKYQELKSANAELEKVHEELKKQMEQLQQKLKKEQKYCTEILKQNEQLK